MTQEGVRALARKGALIGVTSVLPDSLRRTFPPRGRIEVASVPTRPTVDRIAALGLPAKNETALRAVVAEWPEYEEILLKLSERLPNGQVRCLYSPGGHVVELPRLVKGRDLGPSILRAAYRPWFGMDFGRNECTTVTIQKGRTVTEWARVFTQEARHDG